MNNTRSILVTGTSTGIGRACTKHLAEKGFQVFAGVRKQEDMENWKKEGIDNIFPLFLDVTDERSIQKARDLLFDKTQGELYGLLNNAGVGTVGVIEASPMEEVRKVFDVNVIGLIAVTRIFLPFLRKVRGRIINIGSSSSFFAGPGLGIYAGSKFAVRAISDSLRHEMSLFGVSVSLVAPGPVESEIWEKSKIIRDKIRNSSSAELLEAYHPFIKLAEKAESEIKTIPAFEVARSVEHALTSKNPKAIYLVGKNARRARFISFLPNKWISKMISGRLKEQK